MGFPMAQPAQPSFLAHFAALRDPRQMAKVLLNLPQGEKFDRNSVGLVQRCGKPPRELDVRLCVTLGVRGHATGRVHRATAPDAI